MTTPKKGNYGCLWLFVLGLLSLFSFIIIKAIFNISSGFAGFVAVFSSLLFLKIVLGKTSFKNLLRSGVYVFIALFVFQFAVRFLLNTLLPDTNKNEPFTTEEEISETKIIKDQDTLILYTSNRVWRDNYGNNYNGNLSVRKKDYQRLKNHINQYQPKYEKTFWRDLYSYIEGTDTPSLDLIMETFIKINQDKKLNQMEFAEMVVSCIQDIPYSFVFQKECPTENYDITTKHILEKCPECCIGNVKYGIQNPVSFIKNLKGDCDTRTVIIYSILKYFNYDVAIVNSEFYRHSIIGINLPASGLHKIYKGKKYTLWETTAKYFEVGYLSPGFDDVTYWNVVLTSK